MKPALLLAAAALAGCASHEAHLASPRVVGMTHAQLLQCAGPPDKITRSDGQEVETYRISTKGSELSVSLLLFGKLDASSSGQCEADWTLRDGRAVSLYYTRNAASGLMLRDSACYSLVQGCLAMLDREGRR